MRWLGLGDLYSEKVASTCVQIWSQPKWAQVIKSTHLHASPGQMELQADPSFQLASTCDSVWPGLYFQFLNYAIEDGWVVCVTWNNAHDFNLYAKMSIQSKPKTELEWTSQQSNARTPCITLALRVYRSRFVHIARACMSHFVIGLSKFPSRCSPHSANNKSTKCSTSIWIRSWSWVF